MAAPNYRGFGEYDRRSTTPGYPPVERPLRRRRSYYGGRSNPADRRRAAKRRQRFLALVVVPVLLLLGSVYLHGVSARAADKVNLLNSELRQTRAERQSLEVSVAKLSAYDRIRSLAESRLGMKDPEAQNVTVYSGEGGSEGAKGAR